MAKNSREKQLDLRLIEVYKTRGLKMFLEVCSEMLNVYDPSHSGQKKYSNGEVCEVVLRVMTQHYLKTRRATGAGFHSMILRDRWDSKNPFRTEVDFTLLTPGVCLMAECKSFVGDIVISGDCTLTRGSLVADVAKQSVVHGKAIKPYLKEFTLPATGIVNPPLGLFCFLYSKGTVKDTRTVEKKRIIPIISVNNLFAYYDKVLGEYSRKVYDYERARKEFHVFSTSEQLHREHKAYLGY